MKGGPAKRKTGREQAGLLEGLEALARAYGPCYLDTDPLDFVRRFERPEDREIAGLLAAAISYGRVASIRASLEALFGRLGTSPRRFLESYDPRRDSRRFDGFRHRWTDGADIALFLWLLAQAVAQSGSLETFFVAGDRDPASNTLEEAMNRFGTSLFSLDAGPFAPDGIVPERARVRWLLPVPRGGSTCKRHCLYLRWMVRPDDGLDCGIWRSVSPSRLLLPLDVHLIRLARALGWTRRRSPCWAMVVEVTDFVRQLDPSDPTRFDFALCRLGILGLVRPRRGRLGRREIARALEHSSIEAAVRAHRS